MQADDLAPALVVDRHRDYGGERDDATALALAQVGGVQPQIRPVTGQGPVQKAFTRSSMSLHSLETVLFEIPLSPMA